MKPKLTAVAAVCVLLFTFGPSQRAWAQATPFAKQGLYLGLVDWPGTTVKSGDFDGGHFLYDADQVILIPRLDADDGLGVALGGRFQSSAIELSYVRARHQASFGGARGAAESHVVNFDGKYFFFSGRRIQPYLLGGFSVPWLVVKEGSSTGRTSSDATLLGVGLNLGVGLAVYVHQRVALAGGYNYRLVRFPRAKGATGSFRDVDDEFEPIGMNGNLTALVMFTF